MTEVSQVTRRVSDDDLASLSSVKDLAAYAAANGIASVDLSDFGTGVELLGSADKVRLVGVEFYILDWRFTMGDHGEFCSLTIMTKGGEKYVINDGSSGIYRDMLRVDKKTGGTKPVIKVAKGLTRSDFTYVDDNGVEKPATTYYLNFGR